MSSSARLLPASSLRWTCDPAALGFSSTEELPAPDRVVGQDRAVASVRFAIDMAHPGYNLVAVGPDGVGRHSVVRQFLEAEAARRPAPPDLVYVHCFADSATPMALTLAPGQGPVLQKTAAALVDEREQRTKTVREAQRLMNLMTSPDRSVRQRARTRLERLAKESGNETIEKLVPRMDEYVQAVDEAQARAAELGDSMMVGEVMSTFRVTLARLKRPIQQITTNLASGPFPSAPVTLQLPELEVIRVRTTGVIPVVGP